MIQIMQKKINLLATLLVLSIVLGALSTCSSASFREGFQRGTEDGMAAYESGKQAGENVREKFAHEHSAELRLMPKDYRAFPMSIRNTKTGEEMPMSLQAVRLGYDKEPAASGSHLLDVLSSLGVITLFVIGIGGPIAIILLLLVFITSVKSGGIFLKGNEKLLRWMGGILLAWYAMDWLWTLVSYFHLKSVIALEDYTIMYDVPNGYPLVLGFTLLLFAQIFAKGRKMEEDQEFMV